VALNSSRTMTAKKSDKAGAKGKKTAPSQEGPKGVRARLTKPDKKGWQHNNAKKSAKASVSLPAVDVPALAPVKSTSKAAPAAKARAVKAVVAPPARKPVKPVRARRVARNDHVASEIAQAMLGEMESFGSEDSALQRQAQRSQRERELLNRLAVSMSRTDEMPNLELAADLVLYEDAQAVGLLVGVVERHDLEHAPDAARVLCEVGLRAPHLLLEHAERLLALCDESQRDVLPYTMYAFSPVAHRHAEALWDMRDLFWSALADLSQPADMAQAGAVRLLSALCAAGPDYARTLAGGLVDLLGKCMPKDVAFFAEAVLPALGTAHSHRAKPVLDRRMKELTPAEVARLRRAVRAAQTGQPLFAAA
jgi:hypothetical protein